jgi:predicted RNA-binding protein with PIN domain
MPIFVDGNNLLHRLPGPSRSRDGVRRLVLETTRHERMAVVVVFDGPPPAGAPSEESLGSVTVIYAGATKADDVIIGRLPQGGTARQWVVVTDDRALGDRARQRGAQVRRLDEWRQKRPATPKRVTRESKLSSREVQEWEAFFSSDRSHDE